MRRNRTVLTDVARLVAERACISTRRKESNTCSALATNVIVISTDNVGKGMAALTESSSTHRRSGATTQASMSVSHCTDDLRRLFTWSSRIAPGGTETSAAAMVLEIWKVVESTTLTSPAAVFTDGALDSSNVYLATSRA